MKSKLKREDLLISKYVGLEIKRIRKEYGYSGTKMALLLNISQQQYSRYERGESQLTIAALFRISNALNYPICAFFMDYIIDRGNVITPYCNDANKLNRFCDI